MTKYNEIVDYLLNEGFKRIDVSVNGNEVFSNGRVKFAVEEVE